MFYKKILATRLLGLIKPRLKQSRELSTAMQEAGSLTENRGWLIHSTQNKSCTSFVYMCLSVEWGRRAVQRPPDFSEGHRETCRPRKHVRIYFLGAFFLENRLILLSVSISKNKGNPSNFQNHWSKVKLMHLCPNAYNEPGTVMARRIRREMSQTGCFLWQLPSKNSQFTGVGVR